MLNRPYLMLLARVDVMGSRFHDVLSIQVLVATSNLLPPFDERMFNVLVRCPAVLDRIRVQ